MKINRYPVIIALILAPFIYFNFKYSSDIFSNNIELQQQIRSLEKTIKKLELKIERTSFVNNYKIPQPVVFCGDTLDLADPIIKEAVEREFYVLLTNQAQVLLYLKRTQKYFPMIESYLQQAELPADIKYLAVHESALLPTIRSKSHAVGIWQFMRSTARLCNLNINSYIDERRDPERATQAAMIFIKNLYNQHQNWPLVLAAYNGGQGRIIRAVEKQRSNSFFDLSLPEETERYYFKIVATKIILSHPKNFGIYLEDHEYYLPQENYRIEFTIQDNSMQLNEIADICGLTLGQFKELNPSFIKSYLPYGKYTMRIPYENYSVFVKNCEQYNDGQFNYAVANDPSPLFDYQSKNN